MKNKTTQGLGNENVLSFPKHDSLKYWRLKSNVNSHMSIQYVNHWESRSFPDLVGDKWCLQRKYMCRQHETLDYRNFHKPLSNSCYRSGKRQLNGYLFFNWYLRLGNQTFDFLMLGQQNFCYEKHFSSVPPPAINNDRSLTSSIWFLEMLASNSSTFWSVHFEFDYGGSVAATGFPQYRGLS
jgi:hypothetical protein